VLGLAVGLALLGTAEAKTLRVAIPTFPSLGLNTLTASNLPALYTFAALFDALTWVDIGGIAKPQLAESWTAKDEHTWLFKLRPGVAFSNGEPLTADSVAFWINLLQTPEGATYAVRSELGPLAARALDALTLEVTTPDPNPFLPQELSLLRIMSPRHWREAGPDGAFNAPVGSGPYVMETLEKARMVLKAAPQSWRRPHADRLELIVAGDPGPRLAALMSGRVDVAVLLGPDDIGTVEGAGYRMAIQPEPAVITLAFITVKPGPQQDVRVRRALNYAVNKDEIVKGILGGTALPAGQPAASIAFAYDPEIKPYPYDPALAKKLLAEAGYPDGFTLIGESYTGAAGYTTLVLQKVAADLAKVGVRLEARSIPTPKYARGLNFGDWDGTAIGIDYNSAPSLDPLRAFRRHSCLWKKPWYCDETIMPLLKEAMGTFDLDKRRALTRQVLRYQRDQAAAVFLHEQPRFDAMSPKVRNFRMTVGYLHYADLDIDD
jgi:peptide/nickel transport system substrate-binding protein